ncbi:MAG: PAS domain S-box protein [Methanoregula sp.]
MVPDPHVFQHKKPDGTSPPVPEHLLLKRLTIVFGLLAVGISITGILAARFTIVLVGGAIPGNKTIALSAALIWIILGSVLAYHTVKPFGRIAGLGMQVFLVLIAVAAGVEFIVSIMGDHSPLEKFFISAGMTIMGPSSSPLSPVAAILAVVAALSLAAIIRSTGNSGNTTRMRDVDSILGFLISLVSITFVLSYAYGNPLLYGTFFIPVAFISAVAAFFIGASLIAAAGPGAFPVRYLVGTSTSARLLRVFVPLVAVVILSENLIFVGLSSWFSIRDAVLLSSILVVFVFATALVVARVSGGMGRALEKAQEELSRKNDDLGNLNEELTAYEEELRQNIDELTRAEEEIRRLYAVVQEEKDRLFSLVQSINDEIWFADTQKKFTLANPAALREFSIASLTGKDVEDFARNLEVYRPDGTPRPVDEAPPLRALKGELVKNQEELVRTPGHGELRYRQVSAAPVRDAKGNIIGSVSVVRDITENKKGEEALKRKNEDLNALNEEIIASQEELLRSNEDLIRSEEELRKTSQYLENLIDYANAPIIVWDPQFVITRFNHAFEELTGRTSREIVGQRLEVLFPRHYLDQSMESIRKTMNGERLKGVEIPILNRNGEIRIVLWNSATLFESDGKTIQSTIAQGNDITDRKAAEAELETRNAELKNAIEEFSRQGDELSEALKEKEILLSEIHHRVKNNLTAFISLLSLKGSYEETPSGNALKKDLQNRARSMALIHETLYRTGKYSQVDMKEYLSPLIRQIALSYDPSSLIKTEVKADETTLDLSRATPCGLIVTELITNSFKYAFPSPFDCMKMRSEPCTIRVSLEHEGEEYCLSVSDNGIGLPHGFDIRTAQSLGLRLVYFLARHQLKARIEVKTESGTEITFRFV